MIILWHWPEKFRSQSLCPAGVHAVYYENPVSRNFGHAIYRKRLFPQVLSHGLKYLNLMWTINGVKFHVKLYEVHAGCFKICAFIRKGATFWTIH